MREDAAVRGEARFAGDLAQAGALALVIVSSTVAAGRVRIDADAARAAPGVVAVFVADDLDLEPIHEIAAIPERFAQPPLARDAVHYVGEHLAAVVADSEAAAVDAAELVVVDYDVDEPSTDGDDDDDDDDDDNDEDNDDDMTMRMTTVRTTMTMRMTTTTRSCR